MVEENMLEKRRLTMMLKMGWLVVEMKVEVVVVGTGAAASCWADATRVLLFVRSGSVWLSVLEEQMLAAEHVARRACGFGSGSHHYGCPSGSPCCWCS